MTNEELCILAQEGNADAEEELIHNLLPSLQALAAKFEAQYSGLQIESDDLLQEGSIGFLRAIHSFSPAWNRRCDCRHITIPFVPFKCPLPPMKRPFHAATQRQQPVLQLCTRCCFAAGFRIKV